jgi:hypothetical protein
VEARGDAGDRHAASRKARGDASSILNLVGEPKRQCGCHRKASRTRVEVVV